MKYYVYECSLKTAVLIYFECYERAENKYGNKGGNSLYYILRP